MPMNSYTVRVRSAARAFAAGEMTMTEYRRIRRDAIQAFRAGGDADGETTQRRWDPSSAQPEATEARRPGPVWQLVVLNTIIYGLLVIWLI